MQKYKLILLIGFTIIVCGAIGAIAFLSLGYFIPTTTKTSLPQMQNMDEFRRSFSNDGESFITSGFDETIIKSGLIVRANLVKTTPTEEGYVIYEFDIRSSIKNPHNDEHIWLYEPTLENGSSLYDKDLDYLLFLSRTLDVYEKHPICFNFGSVMMPINADNELLKPIAMDGTTETLTDLTDVYGIDTYEQCIDYINLIRSSNSLLRDGIYDYHGRFIDSLDVNSIVEEANYILEVKLDEILHTNRLLQESRFNVTRTYKGQTNHQIIISIPYYVPLTPGETYFVCLYKDANYTVAGYTSVVPMTNTTQINAFKVAIDTFLEQAINQKHIDEDIQNEAMLDPVDLSKIYRINEEYLPYIEINEDMVGWFKIEGTDIDYPVLQGDDNAYYLKHNIKKEPYNYGSIILDYRCDIKSIQRNTMVYGHNMKQPIMFHDIVNYKNKDFFMEHPIIEFNTLYENMQWEVFAVYVVDGGYVYSISFPLSDDTDFQAYLDDINSKNMYQMPFDITLDDKLLTLVTCSYEFDNARTIVHARLIQ